MVHIAASGGKLGCLKIFAELENAVEILTTQDKVSGYCYLASAFLINKILGNSDLIICLVNLPTVIFMCMRKLHFNPDFTVLDFVRCTYRITLTLSTCSQFALPAKVISCHTCSKR